MIKNQPPLLSHTKRTISRIYLYLVPLMATVIGFGIGYVSYKIYLPIWILHVGLMFVASWTLGLHVIRDSDFGKRQFAAGAFLMILPWALISMFAGLGPPPETPSAWVYTSKEQEIRYFMLVLSGVMLALGYSVMRDQIKIPEGRFFALLGWTIFLMAIPLFLINMIWWGSYLGEFLKHMANLEPSVQKPDWFLPVRMEFRLISAVEVSLSYLATACFAAAFYKAGWLGRISLKIYITFSVLCTCVMILSLHLTSLEMAGFFISIPATPFLMPYFMGIQLLESSNN